MASRRAAHHETGRNHQSAQAASATITVSFDFSTVTDPGFDKGAVWHLDKQTGAVLSVDLTSLGGDLAALEFTLAAGDPYLFKYATGRSFALQ